MGILFKNCTKSKVRLFFTLFFVFYFYFINLSCYMACKYKTYSSFSVGVNPLDSSKRMILNDYYYLKNAPWFAWEGRTHERINHKLIIKNHWKEKDITLDLANEIGRIYSLEVKEKFLKTGFNDLDFTVSQAYSLNEKDWLILMGHVCLYKNGKVKMSKEKLFNPKYIGGNFILNLKKVEENMFDIYLFNIETGKNILLEQISKALKDIPKLMNKEEMKVGSNYCNIYDFTYDVENYKAFLIVTYNVEDYYDHTYLMTFEKGKRWIKKKIKNRKGKGITNLTYFKNNLYIKVTDFKSEDYNCKVGIIKNGKIKFTNKFTNRFIYYKGSLYGTDLQDEHVVKIAD